MNVTPFEPEWEGHVTLEISNTLPAKIYFNEGLAQVVFLRADRIADLVRGYPGEFRQEARTFENWLSIVGTAQQEAEGLSKVAPASFLMPCPCCWRKSHMQRICGALGNPEQPSTAEALNAIEHILFAHKLTHRPASPKLPITVRTASCR